MDQFLKDTLPKLIQGEIDKLNRPIYQRNGNQVITFQKREHQAQMGSLVNLNKYLRKNDRRFFPDNRSRGKEYFLTHSMQPALT